LPQSEVLSPGGLPLEARGRAGIRLARPFTAPEIGRGDWTTRRLFECAGEFDPRRAVPSRTGQSAPKEERVEFTRSKGDDLGAELFPAEHALVLTLEGEVVARLLRVDKYLGRLLLLTANIGQRDSGEQQRNTQAAS